MVIIETDEESDIIGNTILILAISHFVFAVLLTIAIGSVVWTPIIAIVIGFALSFGYYIRATWKIAKKKKDTIDNGKTDVEGG